MRKRLAILLLVSLSIYGCTATDGADRSSVPTDAAHIEDEHPPQTQDDVGADAQEPAFPLAGACQSSYPVYGRTIDRERRCYAAGPPSGIYGCNEEARCV